MTTPAPVVRGDLIAAVRQAVVDTGKLGRAVYRAEGVQDPKTPYALLEDTEPSDALTGDGLTLTQSRVVLLTVYQSNSRDADQRLAHDLSRLLHGQRIHVGVESDPTTWRRLTLRCLGRVNTVPTEGLNEQELSITCYGPPVP